MSFSRGRLLKDRNVDPASGWIYFCHPTEFTCRGKNFVDLVSQVRIHFAVNDISEPHEGFENAVDLYIAKINDKSLSREEGST